MAQGKKISELTEVSSVTDNDEFLFVDKEGSGANSGQGGKTAKIKFSDLKSAIGAGTTGAKGASGDKGMKGEPGPRGLDGDGTQYWTQSPTDGDAVYYDAGNVGIGTTSPAEKFVVHGGHGTNDLVYTSFDPAGANPQFGFHKAGMGRASTFGFKDTLEPNGDFLRYSIRHGNYASTSYEDADVLLVRNSNDDTIMSFRQSGYVGIGTDSPVEPLHIESGSDCLIKCTQLIGSSTHDASNIAFYSKENETETLMGRVGIFTNLNNEAEDEAFYIQAHGAGGKNNVIIRAGGASRMTVTNDGTVGIGTGTNSIIDNLEVRADDVADGEAANFGITIRNLGPNPARMSLQNSEGDGYIDCNNELIRIKNVSGSDARGIVIAKGGKVGIGTDNPQAPTLHTLTNDTYNQVIIETKAPAQAAGYQLLTPEGKWILENRSLLDDQNQPVKDTSDFVIRQSGGDNSGEKFVVQHTTGNVGIGTAEPLEQLHVEGRSMVRLKKDHSAMTLAQHRLTSNAGKFGDGVDLGGFQGSLNLWSSNDDGGDGQSNKAGSLKDEFVSLDFTTSYASSSSIASGYTCGRIGTIFEGLHHFENGETSQDRGTSIAFANTNSNGKLQEQMRITSSGNVGIGTGAPDSKLDVRGRSISQSVLISGKDWDVEKFGALTERPEDTDNLWILEDARERLPTGSFWGSRVQLIGADAENDLSAVENYSGQGFTPYQYLIESGDGSHRYRWAVTANGGMHTARGISIRHGIGTHNQTQFNTNEEPIRPLQVHSNMPGGLAFALEEFSNNPFGMGIYFQESTPNNTSNYFFNCGDKNGSKMIVYSNGTVSNATGGFSQLTSDERLKTNIKDANSQWDDIKNLEFKNFKLKSDGENANSLLGVIAQQAKEVSPSLVYERDPLPMDIVANSEFGKLYQEGDEIPEDKKVGDVKEVNSKVLAFKDSVLFLKCAKALQEAITRIETLESELNALKNK
jgi:hypothetical protein